MRHVLFGGILLIALIALSTNAAAQGCTLLTEGGWYPDYDCDTVPDAYDNCPAFPNAQQYDMNRNGVGDACDVLIEELIVEPDTHIRQGEFAHLIVRVINNRQSPISDILINVRNKDLGIDTLESLPYVPMGESAAVEFWLKVPACATAKNYDLSVSSSFSEGGVPIVEQQPVRIFVEKSDRCSRSQGPLDNTIIDVFGRVDADRGEAVIIPITVTNQWDSQASYHVSVEDLAGWGSWRIDPGASLDVPAGHEGTVYLYLQTGKRTEPGTRTIDLTITSGGQQTVVPVDVYVRALAGKKLSLGAFILEALLILFLMLVVGVLGLLVLLHLNRRHGKKTPPPEKKDTAPTKKPRKKVAVEKAEDKNIETYY